MPLPISSIWICKRSRNEFICVCNGFLLRWGVICCAEEVLHPAHARHFRLRQRRGKRRNSRLNGIYRSANCHNYPRCCPELKAAADKNWGQKSSWEACQSMAMRADPKLPCEINISRWKLDLPPWCCADPWWKLQVQLHRLLCGQNIYQQLRSAQDPLPSAEHNLIEWNGACMAMNTNGRGGRCKRTPW